MPHVFTCEQALERDETGFFATMVFRNAIDAAIEDGGDPIKVEQLLDWVYQWNPPSYEEAVRRALKAQTLEECHAVLREATAKRKGRPATKRLPAVKALIYREYLGWTWDKATRRFCSCPKSKHDASCQESLRNEVKILKRQLRKYGVTLS